MGDDRDPLLRRPLSLYDVDSDTGQITLLYKIVGRGTRILSLYGSDQIIDVMGPLGQGFNLVEGRRIMMVGGGVGIAPLLFLGRELASRYNQVFVLHGAGNSDEICSQTRFNNIGVDYMAATMDGSTGFKGLVTDMMRIIDPLSIDHIYTCGPEPMMAEVAAYAARHGISGQLSLEEHLACGVGACLGCARKLKETDEAYVKICKDGPVFPLEVVKF
ncbi:dihydroorotate dehydrogenase electron transfer subunit [hydrocarbon metagenome]|uniref:Dihydroorotate dehydrogenase electron transfer subunit n=1 Tax=hydrocarbon metagenome TaxID=938273 RepID=A0A0W8E5A4_9ZZZZ